MALVPKLIFDFGEGTAHIEFWDNGELVSSLEYDNATGNVHLPVKPETVEVDYGEALELEVVYQEWIEFILERFNPPLFPQSEHELELYKEEDKVAVKVVVDGTTVRDDDWNKGTNNITYGPRDELTMSWADYYFLRLCGEKFFIEIKNFSKGVV